ncbi:MAG: STAS/SEC14 domain-containing protein [Marinibacterium sp.]
MIEQIPTTRDDLLEFRIAPPVTDSDYKDVLMPALDAAIEASDKIRLLLHMEAGPGDYTLKAMLDDSRVGLKHWRGFDRIAMVTDNSAMTHMVKAMSVFFPSPVMVFAKGQEEDAKRWLTESLGSIHQIDLGDGVLQVQLLGKLDPATYAEENEDLNAFIRAHDRFRLLLDLREFDGWQGLGGVTEHLKLVRDHAPLLDRVAVLGDAGWQKMAAELGRRILGKDARYFDGDDLEAAIAWLKS